MTRMGGGSNSIAVTNEDKLIDVTAEMDARYSEGEAYSYRLVFDKLRMAERKEMRRRMIGNLRPTKVLEVGCGSESAAARMFPTAEVWGLDISSVALGGVAAKHPKVHCVCSPLERIRECKDLGDFDLVLMEETIEHLVDVVSALECTNAVMKDGGLLFLSTPNRDSLHCRIGRLLGVDVPMCCQDHVHEFRYVELVQLMRQCGFEAIESRGVGFAPYWALESVLGDKVRALTDNDETLNLWLNDIGRHVPAEYAFLQVHLFRKA